MKKFKMEVESGRGAFNRTLRTIKYGSLVLYCTVKLKRKPLKLPKKSRGMCDSWAFIHLQFLQVRAEYIYYFPDKRSKLSD